MSRRNLEKKEAEVKVEVKPEVKAEAEVLKDAGAPEKLSFEEMKKLVSQYKELEKQVKALPKEEREKLLPPIRKREIPESLKKLSETIFENIKIYEKKISDIFKDSETVEKPEGNKSISFSIDDSLFTVAIIRKVKKEKK